MAAILFELVPGVLSAIDFDATLALVHLASADATEHPVEEGAALSDHVKANLSRVTLEGLITNTPINSSTVEIITKTGAYKAVAPLRGTSGQLQLQVPAHARGELGSSLYRNRWRNGAQLSGGNMPVVPAKIPLVGGLGPPTQLRIQPSPIKVTPAERQKEIVSVGGASLQFAQRVDRVRAVFDVLEQLCTKGIVCRLLTDHREYPSMLISSVTAPQKPEDAMHFNMELRAVRFANVVTTTVKVKATAEKRAQPTVAQGSQAGYALAPVNRDELRSILLRLISES